MRAVVATKKQINIPIPAGTAKEMAVHFRLFVSFPMVIQVVEQGQCISENKMVHTAVNHVHPLSTKSACNCVRSLISMRLPVCHNNNGYNNFISWEPKNKCEQDHPIQSQKLCKGI